MPGRNVGVIDAKEQVIKIGTDTMKWNKKFKYPTSVRSLINGKRHYSIDNRKLPSVTTILSATQSPEEKRQSLANWRSKTRCWSREQGDERGSCTWDEPCTRT